MCHVSLKGWMKRSSYHWSEDQGQPDLGSEHSNSECSTGGFSRKIPGENVLGASPRNVGEDTGQDRLQPSKCPKGELDHTPGNPGVPVQLGRFNLTRLNLQILEVNRWHWTSREIPRHPMPKPRAGRRVPPEGTRRPAQEQELHPSMGQHRRCSPHRVQKDPTQGTTHPRGRAVARTRRLVDRRSTSTPSTPSSPEGLEPPRSPQGLEPMQPHHTRISWYPRGVP